jgi:uncharacterized protein
VYTGADVSTTRATFCSAPHDALIVTPTGDLVTCYEVTDEQHPLADVSTIGRLDPGRVNLNDERRGHLQSLISARRDTCRDCYCYWTCAGDCYARSFGPGPAGHLTRGASCELNRALTAAILLRLVAVSGGVWRRVPRPTARPSFPTVPAAPTPAPGSIRP